MNAVRTIGWIIVTAIVVAFVSANYGEPQEVRFWFGDKAPVVDWPVGVIALVFFVLGLAPMWLVHRAAKWQWQRRVIALEAAARVPTPAPAAPPAQAAAPEVPATPQAAPETTADATVSEEPKAEEPKP